MAVSSPKPAATAPATLEAQIVEVVRELLLEQGKQRAAASVTPRSSFQKDLGLASLDLVELVVRCESKLELEIPDEIAESADTASGWAKAIREGNEDKAAKSAYRIVPPARGVAPPENARTLVDVLAWHAQRAQGRVHVHLLEQGSGQGITCDQMFESATRLARGLISLGLVRNDTVGILLPGGAEFFDAFFGVMLAGGIAVPLYPPANLGRIAEYTAGQVHILRSAGIRFLITFSPALGLARLLRVNVPTLIEVATVDQLKEFGTRTSARLPNPSATALVQYTSGTTASPKGAVLSHDGILANIRAIGKAIGVRDDDAVVSWLPLSSDLGLVGCWLFSLYHGTPLTLLPPLEFLERPECWLWAIHDSKGTLSPAPNFAYELCTRRIPLWTIEGLDLSSWRLAVNAGEAVMPGTIERFARRFAPFGLRAEALTPAYGLAENSVALAMAPAGRPPRVQGGAVSVGPPLENHQVRIVDASGRDLAEGETGHLWFRGPSQCQGYWQNEADTKATSHDGWMDSGDLAFLSGGELYFAGRSKDVIVNRGRQIAPEPVEHAVSAVAGVTPDSVAVIGVRNVAEGTDQIVVIAGTSADGASTLARVEAGVRSAARDALGHEPDDVRITPAGALPKTANGKIRRTEARKRYQNGELGLEPSPPRIQLASLWWANAGILAARALARAARVTRDATRLVLARFIARLAGLGRSRASAQWAAGAVLSILGRRPAPEGTAMRGPVVIVSNRCNPFDALSVVSLIENEVVLAGEEALLGLPPWAARLLRPLVVVTREEMERELRAGKTLVLFPEVPLGTPVARCRYRLRAIEAAIAARRPLLPFGMQIIRNKLFFRVGSPLAVEALGARDLRQRVRQAIRAIYA